MNPHPIPTSVSIPAEVRAKVIPLLQDRLADAIDLYTHVKQAHWNVKGPSFIALHELFDEVADAIEEHIDETAERLVQLGGVARGTARMVASRTTLGEYPDNLTSGLDHCRALAKSLAYTGKCVRDAIDTSAAAGDADTADLFTGFSRTLDKQLWFVEAHLHAER